MHKLYELKEKLIKELEEFSEKGLSDSSLKSIDTLAHAAKNLGKVIETCEEEGYSSSMDGYSRRDSYADEGINYVRPDGSYARGRGRGARRDSMGRYSSAEDDMVMQLEKLMHSAKDEHTKKELRKILERM